MGKQRMPEKKVKLVKLLEVESTYYRIMDEEEGTCELCKADLEDTCLFDYEILPEITYEGQTYKVTSIGHKAFNNCNIWCLQIPDGIWRIGDSAFQECRNLTYVKMFDSVIDIENGAFAFCTDLSEIVLSQNLMAISSCMFYGCRSLEHIDIPKSVTYICESAFHGCEALTEVEIPDSVTYLSGFEKCVGLKGSNISNSVTTIGDYAFYGCSGLTRMVIPGSVAEIGQHSFELCTGLTEVAISPGVTKIGGYAFAGCTGLTELTIPESVKTIEHKAFGCAVALDDHRKSCTVTTKLKSLRLRCRLEKHGGKYVNFFKGMLCDVVYAHEDQIPIIKKLWKGTVLPLED